MRSLIVALVLSGIAVPAVLTAQDEEIDLMKARKEFVAGQPRAAANSLLMASLGVRSQVGRCRDETVGTDLLNAESDLEKLAGQLRAGTVKYVKVLDARFASIDVALAHHHLLLAQAAAAHPRQDNIPPTARDLDRLAYHFQRSFTFAGQKPMAAQAEAIADALKLSGEIDATNAMPSTAVARLAVIEKELVAKKNRE